MEKRTEKKKNFLTGYLMWTLLSYLFVSFAGALLNYGIRSVFPEAWQTAGYGLTGFLWLLFYRCKHPRFSGMMDLRNFPEGMKLLLPMAVLPLLNLIGSLQGGLTEKLFTAFGFAASVGIYEEIIFRGAGIAEAMKRTGEEKEIPALLLAGAVTFSLPHAANLLLGADPVVTVLQVVSTFSTGLLFCAVMLKTACLPVCMVYHFLIDFAAFLSADLLENGGVVSSSAEPVDIVYAVCAVLLGVYAFKITSGKNRKEILAVWDERWNRT